MAFWRGWILYPLTVSPKMFPFFYCIPQYRSIDDDPKIATGRRYKELSFLFNILAARAVETEETYEIAVVGNNRILQDVEARIKKMGVNQEKVTTTRADETDELDGNMIADGLSDEPRIKGIKVKPEKNKVGSSRRFMSALEKATRKRRSKNKISTSRTTKVNMQGSNLLELNLNSPYFASPTEVCPDAKLKYSIFLFICAVIL
ncbi:hypothetical protein OROHE_005796 [Orobanche hederae]